MLTYLGPSVRVYIETRPVPNKLSLFDCKDPVSWFMLNIKIYMGENKKSFLRGNFFLLKLSLV